MDTNNIQENLEDAFAGLFLQNQEIEEEIIKIEDKDLHKEIREVLGIWGKYITKESIAEGRSSGPSIREMSSAAFKILVKSGLIINLSEKLELKEFSFEGITEQEIEAINIYIKNIRLSNLNGITPEILDKISIDYLCIDDSHVVEGVKYQGAYTKAQLLEMVQLFDKIKSEIPKNASEIEKFMYIYKTIGKFADYDRAGCADEDFSTQEAIDLTRSLTGVLIEGRAVCRGYSVALMYLLRYVGIDCNLISGIGKNLAR